MLDRAHPKRGDTLQLVQMLDEPMAAPAKATKEPTLFDKDEAAN